MWTITPSRDLTSYVETRLDVGLQHPVVRLGGEVSGSRRSRPARAGSGETRTSTAGSPPRRWVPAPPCRRPGPPGRPRWGSPAAQLPAALGDLHLPHRGRPVLARLQQVPDLAQERLHPDPGLDLGHRGPVDPRGPCPVVAGHAFPRVHQKRRVIDQVEQITEPASRDPRSPNDAIWAASSVPRHRPNPRPARPRRRYSPVCLRTLQSSP